MTPSIFPMINSDRSRQDHSRRADLIDSSCERGKFLCFLTLKHVNMIYNLAFNRSRGLLHDSAMLLQAPPPCRGQLMWRR